MIGTEDLEKMTTLEITKKLVSLFKDMILSGMMN